MVSVVSPRRLARSSARHPKRVLAVWAALLVASIIAIATLLSGALTNQVRFLNTPEFQRGADIMQKDLGTIDHPVETLVLTGNVGSATAKAAIADASSKLEALGRSKVLDVARPLTSKDGMAVIVPVTMAGDENGAKKNVLPVLEIAKAIDGKDGLQARVTGRGAIDHDTEATSQSDLATGEAIGIGVALIILLLVFGTVIAALIPLALAIASIIVAIGATALIGSGYQLSFFVTNMITMMGLAVGIDYSLFIVSRYREERAAGRPVSEAIEFSAVTAGRAVAFSGITVVVALVGLLLVPTNIFLSLALGAILVVLAAIAASMTLLPAVLSLLGDRIESLAVPFRRQGGGTSDGFWAKTVDAVMRRPALSLSVVVIAFLALASPFNAMKTGSAGVGSLPASLPSRQAFDTLTKEFGTGSVAPALVVLRGDGAATKATDIARKLTAAVAGDPVFGAAVVGKAKGSAAVITLPVKAPATSDSAFAAVSSLRSKVLPAALVGTGLTSAVTGQTAQQLDFVGVTDEYLPIVVSLVLALSFLILLVAFRSIVIPLKAILMNLLSVGAAYGMLVLVFQKGFGASLFGFQQVDRIEAWLPLFLFAILFGLSMDYHVFLISRIKEQHELTGDTPSSVRSGIVSSSGLITGAALIMVAVFSGFAMGQLAMFQQMGFGLAVAILLDATIVRSVLVPAAMRLLDERNWYLPKALNWLPKVDVEASPAPSGD